MRKHVSRVMQSLIKKKKNQVENEEFPSPILNSRNISSMKNIYATSSRYMYFSLNSFCMRANGIPLFHTKTAVEAQAPSTLQDILNFFCSQRFWKMAAVGCLVCFVLLYLLISHFQTIKYCPNEAGLSEDGVVMMGHHGCTPCPEHGVCGLEG